MKGAIAAYTPDTPLAAVHVRERDPPERRGHFGSHAAVAAAAALWLEKYKNEVVSQLAAC